MHLADALSKVTYIAFKVHICPILAFPGNQIHDFGIACAMILFELQEGECWDGIHPDSNKLSDLIALILIKSY